MKISRFLLLGLVFSLFLCVTVPTNAEVSQDLDEQTKEIESRMRELEDFVTIINSNLVDFSEKTHKDMKEYKSDIEAGLDDYSKSLNQNIEQRVRSLDDRVVVLSLTTKGYHKIETNSGVFLLSINKVKRLPNGYRIIFHIGNPNYASYHGVNLALLWGRKWDPEANVSYDTWRRSLGGAEYSYDGKLGPGTWTEISVDISQVTTKQLEHIECSMNADSIQLNLQNPGIIN